MSNDDLITDLGSAPLPARKPSWLRMKRQGGSDYNDVKRLLRTSSLNTVCESANCPNRGECFNSRTATFMLLGEVCTRYCTFCNIPGGRVGSVDGDEPRRVAEAVRELATEARRLLIERVSGLLENDANRFRTKLWSVVSQNAVCFG